MKKHVSLHRLLIIILLCSTMTYTNISFANDMAVPNTKAHRILNDNYRIRHALNVLDKKDNGTASITYYRQGQVLSFYINDYDDKSRFEGSNLNNQVTLFERLSGIFSVSPQVQVTKKAEHNHSVQVSEQRHQRIENHIEAQKEIVQAKARARAKAKAEKAKRQAQLKKQKQQKMQKIQRIKKQNAQKQIRLKKRQVQKKQKQQAQRKKGNQHATPQKH